MLRLPRSLKKLESTTFVRYQVYTILVRTASTRSMLHTSYTRATTSEAIWAMPVETGSLPSAQLRSVEEAWSLELGAWLKPTRLSMHSYTLANKTAVYLPDCQLVCPWFQCFYQSNKLSVRPIKTRLCYCPTRRHKEKSKQGRGAAHTSRKHSTTTPDAATASETSPSEESGKQAIDLHGRPAANAAFGERSRQQAVG